MPSFTIGHLISISLKCLSVQGNMRHWIEDADCRDQYSVIYEAGERTAIFANDAKEPITAEERAVSSWSHLEMQGKQARIKCNSTVVVGLQTTAITFLCPDAALDRDVRPLVSKRHLPGHLPPTWHCIVGRREVQTDSEVQPSGSVPHRLLTMWEVINILSYNHL